MRRNLLAMLWTTSAAVLIAACAGGADSATGVTPPPPPPVTSATLRLTFTAIEAIEDCDGIEGKGDFDFNVFATRSNGDVDRVYAAAKTLGRGERTGTLGEHMYKVQIGTAAAVKVQFRATEFDKTVFGKKFADKRLDDASGSVEHKWDGHAWSSLGQRTITLGSGNCRVRLIYSAVPL
jgi:hypothetical protein